MERRLRNTLLFLAVTGLVLGMSAAYAAAQEFKAGTAYLEPRGGVYGTFDDHVNMIATYGGALGYFVVDNLSLEAEGLGYYIDQQKIAATGLGMAAKKDAATAFGGSLMARWHMAASDQASFFVAAGAGGLWADRKGPYRGMQYSVTDAGRTGSHRQDHRGLQHQAGRTLPAYRHLRQKRPERPGREPGPQFHVLTRPWAGHGKSPAAAMRVDFFFRRR